MKKSLLLCLAVASSISPVMAESKTPTIYPDAAILQVTDNGRYAISVANGTLTIFDLVDGTDITFAPDEEMIEYYTLGLGNCVTPDGSIILGSTNQNGDAAFYTNGEWHQLNVADADQTNLSNGITPDGSRICGSIGLNPMTFDNVIMQVPVYWDRNADGTYSDYHALPYPTEDFFGQKPQYVTALCITTDGKTIAGQMVFGNGGMKIPVIYKEDEKGEWSYSLPTKDLFNPDGLEAVEDPGDGPMGPNYEEYMTQNELDAYYAAINDYYEGIISDYPDMDDYMSDENRVAYNEALETYQTKYDEWLDKYLAYSDYVTAVIYSSPNFLFNNMYLSTDDKYIISTLQSEDPDSDPWSWFPSTIDKPAYINIETGELQIVESEVSSIASGVADNGVIFSWSGQTTIPTTGYIYKDGVMQDIAEYVSSVNPAYGEWIKENMTHEVLVDIDYETWEEFYEEYTFTGMPVATPDLSIITIWNNTPWDMMTLAESVIFDFTQTTGITTISANNQNLTVDNGTLIIPAGFANVEIFNLSGACVKSVDGAEGSVNLDLGNGVYVAKGTRVDGSTSVIKISK